MKNNEIEETAQLLEELVGANIFLYAELETVWSHFLYNSLEPDYMNVYCLYGKSLYFLEKLENYPFVQTEHARVFTEQVAFCLQNQSLHDTIYDHYKDLLAAKLEAATDELVTYFETLHTHWDELQQSYDPDGDERPLETVLRLRDSIGYILMAIQLLQGKHEQYANIAVHTYERRMLLADTALKVITLSTLKTNDEDIGRVIAPRDFWWRHLE